MLPAHSLYMIKREAAGLIGCKHPPEAAFTTRARDNRAAPSDAYRGTCIAK